jgi:hypothetical protein
MNEQVPAYMDEAPPPEPMAAQTRLPSPERVGQATVVESARAVAEVQAAVVMARQFPRDVQKAIADMRQSCAMPRLAERAFFRYNRGGANVTGPSIHLARDLARCWGNIDYGVKELARDDQYGQSEMLAFAWDLETNARSETVFIVPHARDKKGGPQRLIDMRDIYENNANNGARRLRECIFAVMPPWFKEEAKDICHETLEKGGGKPLPQRIADAVAAFEGVGVTRTQMEKKAGRAVAGWTAQDVAQFGVIFKSIRQGETSVADEFEPEGQVTAAGLKAQAKIEGASDAPQEPTQTEAPATEAETASPPATDDGHSPQYRELAGFLEGCGSADDLGKWWKSRKTFGMVSALSKDEAADIRNLYDIRLSELSEAAG